MTPNTINLQIIIGNQYNPYINLAVESKLLDNYLPDTITMFLWKNSKTVVIGTNQNPYSECDIDTLFADGGFIARRRTGGGAVYHDLGNLNFSFVADKDIYDVKRQMRVIQNGEKIRYTQPYICEVSRLHVFLDAPAPCAADHKPRSDRGNS